MSAASSLKHEDSRKRSVSLGSRVYKVTNYGNVDIESDTISSREFPQDENAMDRRPSISPLCTDHLGTRRPSAPALDIPPFPSTTHREIESHKWPVHLLRRGSHTPSLKSITRLQTQTEENEDEIQDSADGVKDFNANVSGSDITVPVKSFSKSSSISDVSVCDINGLPHYHNNIANASLPQIEAGCQESMTVQKSVSWPKSFASVVAIARRGRLFAKRRRRRLMEKSGFANLNFKRMEKKKMRYLTDLFTTFLEIKWRYTVIVFLVSFCLTWLFFALLWWALVAVRSDTECINGVDSFYTALLFSIETQHTIGYGTRAITDACPVGLILLMLQSTVGVLIQCISAGIVFAKLARPKLRANTVMFSKNAVIYKQDGDLRLMFRVGNMRTSHLMGITINAIIVKTKLTEEGELISCYQEKLNVTTEADNDFFFLAWPIKVMHKIDEDSPLWQMSPDDLLQADFEIIVVLEAVCEATGSTTQVRTSYLPGEIMWGYKLSPLLTHHQISKAGGGYTVDFTQFHNIQAVDTPDMSAAQLSKRRGSNFSRASRIRFESECETFSNKDMSARSSLADISKK